jgi:Sulfotransferase family
MSPDLDRNDSSRDERARVDVIYIGATARSGSTIVEHYLAETLGAAAVGETVYLWSRGVESDHRCGCGERFSRCPFWTRVVREGRLLDRHADGLRELWEGQWHRVWAIPRLVLRGRRDGTLAAAADAYEALFRAVAAVSGRATVIESSKHPAFWLFLRLVPRIRLHTLHVVRDSRAVAFSWRRTVVKPELSERKAHMLLIPHWRTAVNWLIINLLYLAIRGRAHRGGFTTLKYEDFATNPEESIERVRERLGFDASLDAARPQSSEHRAVQHSVSGNPVRFDRDRLSHISLDDEWRTSMPRKRQALVTVLSFPLLVTHRYIWRLPRRS